MSKHNFSMNIAPKSQVQVCNLCKKNIDAEILQDHLIEHEMTNGTVSCVICTSIFTSIVGLKEHIREHNVTALDLKEVCPKCSSRFLYHSELAHHIIEHGISEKQQTNSVKKENEEAEVVKAIKEEEEDDDDYIEIEKVAEI